ncbi:MAG TPA: hypothetical protein VE033_02670 [Acetobacteraceae bacterium]|nr:hypothetical protein [Acetobacteraceae bacterium]
MRTLLAAALLGAGLLSAGVAAASPEATPIRHGDWDDRYAPRGGWDGPRYAPPPFPPRHVQGPPPWGRPHWGRPDWGPPPWAHERPRRPWRHDPYWPRW